MIRLGEKERLAIRARPERKLRGIGKGRVSNNPEVKGCETGVRGGARQQRERERPKGKAEALTRFRRRRRGRLLILGGHAPLRDATG